MKLKSFTQLCLQRFVPALRAYVGSLGGQVPERTLNVLRPEVFQWAIGCFCFLSTGLTDRPNFQAVA